MSKISQFVLDRRLAVFRERLYKILRRAPRITFVRSYGNIGDLLIEEGIRTLLSSFEYDEVSGAALGDVRGHTALIAGGGAWCHPYHEFMPVLLPEVEQRFEKVIVLPSSFDPKVPEMYRALSRTRALIFAREGESYRQIRSLCNAQLGHDCAFYAEIVKYKRRGVGVLNAFRADRESRLVKLGMQLPDDNQDISQTASALDEWLGTIASYETVCTDRAHVVIAAALLGKTVNFVASTYHKVPAIVRHSLWGFSVRRVADPRPAPLALAG